MLANETALYEAYVAKDARFDGRFFIGVASTGIYCRPVCRARQAKRENCSFFANAAQAECAGYRPCLLCRPELAPGSSPTDAYGALARRAARALEEHCGDGQSLEALARQLGCTSRHLRRAFFAEYRVSPVQYRQTCRLLLAKNLLTDTGLSVIEVAMAAGFGSLRRFNDAFKDHYRLSPTALRRQASEKRRPSKELTLALGYRPPYRWERMLRFLAERAIPGVDLVKDGAYWRTVRVPGGKNKALRGWIKVAQRPEKHALALTLSESLWPALPQILSKVKQMFDLYCDPEVIDQSLSRMNALAPGLYLSGTRLPGCCDEFEMAVRAVLGQQITVKAAHTLAGRVAEAFGSAAESGVDGLTRFFPTARQILAPGAEAESRLARLGIPSARARTVLALALAFDSQTIRCGLCADPEEEMAKLLAIPGIGKWTAQYIAMRAMAWPDAFLETDAGVKKALGGRTARERLELAEAWRPWRSYATLNLWHSL